MSITGLPNRAVGPRTVQVLTGVAATSVLVVVFICASTFGLASTRTLHPVPLGGSRSRMRFTGLSSLSISFHTLRSDELTPGLLLAILSADCALCFPLVMFEAIFRRSLR